MTDPYIWYLRYEATMLVFLVREWGGCQTRKKARLRVVYGVVCGPILIRQGSDTEIQFLPVP